MKTLITKNAKIELDLALGKFVEGFEELYSAMEGNGIDVKKIDFMKHIATVIDSGLNIPQYALFNPSETYSNWLKQCVEICEDETVTVDFLLKDGTKFSEEATYNLATNVLVWEDIPENDSKDISSVSFQREQDEEGNRLNVCKECLEGVYAGSDKECSECAAKVS